MAPEQRARTKIDELLRAAGWKVQDREDLDLSAGLGVAVREYQLPAGPCDYLLFVDRKAAGVIEAKPEGVTLTGVTDQAEAYMGEVPPTLASWGPDLIFDYESTGTETLFRDLRDPDARSRHVFAFHRPETLREWLEGGSTLRSRLRALPELDRSGLRDCQIEAIIGLEDSLARNDPRALIQMSTGAGKTFTAASASYRLLEYGKAKRVLFLVDRNNLGRQTKKEFQAYRPPGTGRSFPELYAVQHLQSSRIDKSAGVVISTIQRLYAALRGEEIDEETDEMSGFEALGDKRPVSVAYNPDIPIETFDVIIVDECHRSIYGVWRQVLEYFDAFVIGLTATPSLHTLGFFGGNLVSEYPYERSVADGVNVGYEIYRIRTRMSQEGGLIEAGYQVPLRDRRTRRMRYEQLDEDLAFTSRELDRSVTARNQIRTVIQAYRDGLPTQLFPGRQYVPKTLIFAKDDHHAEEIVGIVREVFGQGNDFAKKITYRSTGDTEQLIKEFRTEFNPRIAVTVDMIATGTDVKAIEVVMFLRDVRSETYFEQMKGRGVRSIDPNELQRTTPEHVVKDKFILIDAVGVTETAKTASQPLERKRTVGFDKLLEQVASGARDDDTLSSLAGRLAALATKLPKEDRARVHALTNGRDLEDVARTLLDAIDPDLIAQVGGEEAARGVREQAARMFDSAPFRRLLVELKAQSEVVIDEISIDAVVSTGFDVRQAEETTGKFRRFMEENRDELLALQILYARPYGARGLTHQAVRDLADALRRPPWNLQPATIWQAYRRLYADRVREASPNRLLSDIVALVRFALDPETRTLEPFSVSAEQRFNLWLGREQKAGRTYSEEQLAWLNLIKAHIAANAVIERDDLQHAPDFVDRGGLIAARRAFGARLDALLDDLSDALVA
jgi:type I restriction enzyme R subunit